MQVKHFCKQVLRVAVTQDGPGNLRLDVRFPQDLKFSFGNGVIGCRMLTEFSCNLWYSYPYPLQLVSLNPKCYCAQMFSGLSGNLS